MFEHEWVQLALGDVAEVIDPHPSHRAPPEVDGGIPFVGIGDITPAGEIISSGARKVSPRVLDEHRTRYTVAKGDIAYGRVATVGKVMRFGEITTSFAISPTMALIKPKANVDASYLAQFLQSKEWEDAVARLLTGTTRSSLGIQLLRKIQVSCPREISEQRVMGAVLDTLDTAIAQTEVIIAKLKAVKQGLLHDLLTRGIDANGELRPPQSEAPQIYKQSALGWIPKEWDIRPLSSYTDEDITYGIVQAGPHVPGGVPYIRTGDMAGDVLERESMLCTSKRIANSYSRSEVRVGDIVISIRATVGKVLPIFEDLDGANLTQGTAKISPNKDTDSEFLLWAIRHSRTQRSIQMDIKGTTFAEISLSALRQVAVVAPVDVTEQRRIGERMAQVDVRLMTEQHGLEKLLNEKAGLMDDLLTGNVRVTALVE